MTLRIVLLLACASSACHSHEHAGAAGHEHPHAQEDLRPALSFTHWTDRTELFIELRALVRGQESACAAHVTTLQPFAALAAGRVTVVLRGPSGDERFEAPGPTVPGIFRPVARPSAAGVRRLLVEVRGEGLSAEHDLGEVTVYETVAAARAAIPEQAEVPGRIPFLKEQQWPLEFATARLTQRALRPSLRVTGSLRPRSDGAVIVTAPAAGRVATSGRTFPRLGQRVVVGERLGLLAPRLESADLASLELAVTSAELEQRFAEREQQRLELLRAEGAVPERRALDAARASDAARATLAAARRRLSQFQRVDRSAGRAEGTLELRTPLAGVITAVDVAPGSFVEAGATLFVVTDTTQLWLEARVPEIDLGRLGEPRGASFQVDGAADAIELPEQALVARGQVIDPVSRTLPVVFAVDNATGRWSVGAFCRVSLFNGPARSALALPESALVDDGAAFVAFVQVEGEAFERRILRLGARDQGYVEVLGGLQPGEHVVTRGAWSVKLAAASGSIPAHGHSH